LPSADPEPLTIPYPLTQHDRDTKGTISWQLQLHPKPPAWAE